MTNSGQRQSIGIVLFDGAEELDWAGPWEVLSYWSHYRPEDEVEVFTVARDNSRPIECAKGLRVLADHSWESAPEIDVLVYPGGSGTRARRSATRRCAPGCAQSTRGPA
jgi:transcriptional regulator GlxA family with amidase domain